MEIIEYQKIKNNRENYRVRENEYECPVCHKIFSIKAFVQHVLKQHVNADNGVKNSGGFNGCYQKSSYISKMRKKAAIRNAEEKEKLYGKKIKKKLVCYECGKKFIRTEREKICKDKYFCSRSCACTRHHSSETKEKIRKSTQKSIIYKYLNDSEYADKITKANNQNKYFSSKNERLIRQHFLSKFPQDEWTFGGCLKYNSTFLTRDLYSNKLKVCFEYDGVWHFKNIHGQLEDKQRKDAALEQWCLYNGYRLIRVSETWFEKTDGALKKIEKFVYGGKEQIIKQGVEYDE